VRRNVISVTATVVIVVVWFGLTLLSDSRPELGLDLQGGVSVVNFPVEGSDTAGLDVAVDIIRNRIDSLGVVEPEVSRQGDTIVVDLPGIENRQEALDLIGATAQLRFRPVCGNIPAFDPDAKAEVAASYVQNVIPDCVEEPSTSTTSTTAPGATTTVGGSTTTAPGSSTAATTTTQAEGDAAAERRIATQPIAAVRPAQETSSTTGGTAPASTTTAPAGTTTTTVAPTTTTAPGTPLPGSGVPTTPRQDDKPGSIVVLPGRLADDAPDGAEPGRYILAPTVLTGEAISSADAQFQPSGEWTVDVDFDGNQFVDKVAQPYVGQPIAIVLDGVVVSAPVIQPDITSSNVQITGAFSEGEARSLARVLKYGALPVQFDPDEQTVRSISPTLGEDQLQAGIVSGIIGLALVALYMIAFYRILGLVVVAGLVLTGMIFFSLVTFLSASQGLTLTLAGVTGLIVSVGVTVDSYVVYFERLKDEVRSGKTVRSSATAGFRKSFRTILTADLVALIGAVILWALAEGSVRGFAFFLGLSTLIDLVIAYFFMHPLVAIMSQRPALVRLPRVGIAAGLDVAGAER
jgi:preprotein translocase subunit SecD